MVVKLNACSSEKAEVFESGGPFGVFLQSCLDLLKAVSGAQRKLANARDLSPLFKDFGEYPADELDLLQAIATAASKWALLLKFISSPSRRLLAEFLADGPVLSSSVAGMVEDFPRRPYAAYKIVDADLALEVSKEILSDDRDYCWALAAVCVEHCDMTELEAAEITELPPSQVAAAVDWYRKLPVVDRAAIEITLDSVVDDILDEQEVHLGS